MKSEKINVLLLFWGRRGAIARCTLELAQAWQRRGHVTLHLSLSRQSELFEATQQLGIPECHVNTYRNAVSALCYLPRIPFWSLRLARYIRQNNIQAVVCMMSHVWNPIAVPLLKRAGALYVVAIHDPVRHLGEQSRFLDQIQTRDVRNADHVMVLSRFAHDELLKTYPFVAPETVMVMPMGAFDGGDSPGRSRPAPSRPARLLFFGRIRDYKGIDLLLEAYGLVRQHVPDARLRIVGDGDMTPYAAQLRHAGPGVSVDNRWVAESEIPALMDAADVLVLPYREATQSAAVPMALRKGVPCVVTPCGALPEQVRHEQTGLVATAVDAPSVAAALVRLLTDPALYARCSENSIRLSEAKGSWDFSAQCLEDDVTAALSNRARQKAKAP
jgi:glycosyltransferase involved in cell wall biosynthesis